MEDDLVQAIASPAETQCDQLHAADFDEQAQKIVRGWRMDDGLMIGDSGAEYLRKAIAIALRSAANAAEREAEALRSDMKTAIARIAELETALKNEREACAKLADERAQELNSKYDRIWSGYPNEREAQDATLLAGAAGEMARFAQTLRSHASDCAIHNGPALPAGPCDCALASPQREGDRPVQTDGGEA